MSYTKPELDVIIEDKWQAMWDYIYDSEHDEDIESARIIEQENTKYNDLLRQLHLKEKKELKIKEELVLKAEYETLITELQEKHKADYEAEQQAEFDNYCKMSQVLWDAEGETF